MSATYDKSEPVPTSVERVPGWTPEVGTRLKLMIEALGGPGQAAIIVGVTPEQLSKWRDGKARASFGGIAALAQASGKSLDWVLTGLDAGPRTTGAAGIPPVGAIDDELFGRVTDAIAKLYKAEHVSLAPVDLGRLAARGYARVVAATDDPAERLVMVKMVVADLRAELHATAAEPGTGKRSA